MSWDEYNVNSKPIRNYTCTTNTLTKLTWLNVIIYFILDHAPGSEMCIIVLRKSFDIVKTNVF